MKASPSPDWTLQDAIEAAWDAYVGSGLTSRGHRNSVVMAWGNVVGRERALLEYEELVSSRGSVERAADSVGFSKASFVKIRRHFARLHSRVAPVLRPMRAPFVRGSPIALEEERLVEFKEVKGQNPAGSIKNTADEYAVAMLNSEGGRVLWGVRDSDRVVVGVPLTYSERDEVRRAVVTKLAGIKPQLDPRLFSINFHAVTAGRAVVHDLYVVEMVVPRSDGGVLFWTESDQAFVRLDGVKKRMEGPQIQAWITRELRRRRVAGASPPGPSGTAPRPVL